MTDNTKVFKISSSLIFELRTRIFQSKLEYCAQYFLSETGQFFKDKS